MFVSRSLFDDDDLLDSGGDSKEDTVKEKRVNSRELQKINTVLPPPSSARKVSTDGRATLMNRGGGAVPSYITNQGGRPTTSPAFDGDGRRTMNSVSVDYESQGVSGRFNLSVISLIGTTIF
jgi:hypothetical protein